MIMPKKRKKYQARPAHKSEKVRPDQVRKVNPQEIKVTIIVVCLLVFAFSLYLFSLPTQTSGILTSLLAFLLFMSVYLLMLNPSVIMSWRYRLQSSPALLYIFPLLLWLLYTLYSFLSDQLSLLSVLDSFIICFLPLLLTLSLRNKAAKLHAVDFMIIFLLWFAVEWDLVSDVTIPKVQGEINLLRVVSVIMIIYLYYIIRSMPVKLLDWKLKAGQIQKAVQIFVIAFPVLLFLGFSFDVIKPLDRFPSLTALFFSFLFIAFFTALPRELLFRAVFHTLLQKRLGKTSYIPALVISSLFYGLSFIYIQQSSAIKLEVSDWFTLDLPWAAMIMAAVTGFFYGYVYIKTQRLMASTLVHLLIVWAWGILFYP
ncbi:CPBP family intramembrane metalloprotease [candidate division KSB1 bacterium]|nr:CPBP family intramembrane metalloprotease [candidate division KSB1 bacterium]